MCSTAAQAGAAIIPTHLVETGAIIEVWNLARCIPDEYKTARFANKDLLQGGAPIQQ